jgi:hypothetical protein
MQNSLRGADPSGCSCLFRAGFCFATAPSTSSQFDGLGGGMVTERGEKPSRNRRFRGKYAIPVDRRIADEVRQLPVNRQYAAIAFLLQAIRDKHCCFRANTSILDHMSGYAGQACRSRLVRFWNASPHVETAKQYLAGSHCTIRKYAPNGGVATTHQKNST